MKLNSFGVQVTIGLIVGIILGLVAKDVAWLAGTLSWVGSTYVQLLKVMIAPLIVTAVVTSVANLRKVTNAARLAGQTLLWFAITSFFSVIAGIVVALVLKPGINSSIDPSTAAEPSKTGSWLGFIESIVPGNIFGLQASANDSGVSLSFSALQLIVISMALGIAAIKAGKAAEPFIKFSESLLAVIQVVLWWIIRLAPIGTAALIGRAVATYGWDAIGSLGKFVLAVYVGLAIVMFVIYPAVLAAHKISVVDFYKKVWPVTSLGFVTRSSMGVMPVNQQIAEQKMGVPREYASFAIPLGATTKMDGCAAVFPAVAAIFVAQFYGIELSLSHYLLIIFVSVIGSAATAGTTGATVMLTLTLSTLGLPLAGVGLLLATEPIVDMGRTAVNVTGQNLSALIVAKREGILKDVESAHTELIDADKSPVKA
ncbi:dicarboxylate/amino acid:cation symporter [Corynebacterium felinum]|uniref:Na+/H+-dicarboxylate symporter n=1 Tax=Corynebacterium felinum TaxID=131318 RepID=A0ABU2BAC5_9CORY|nr:MULTISPECIES: dicarboxylate/amino acid:cation symporter [Corynebacterium]MDF5819794.1 dicarboxylate/amino acid:cation symporter [Corynebacterium felinum]MDO4761977.1 dicarboxylate/amino acid:cation symporter [Corynebacterium sp.]MDR7354334.1 Na+/H+-dicarboxylate symporter [Corynebacterium felinum]WJY93709.1 C4-dicarboxylate transport protein [Corynebacterium felinum]